MSNSSLVNYRRWSPNYTYMTGKKNTHIVIHHMAGNLSVETCGSVFASSSRQASSNYGIGSDGRVGQYVDETNRSWATSNYGIDSKAVTIEVANSSTGGQWPVSDKAMAKLIELCADICRRNGISRLNYTGDKSGNLHMHCWYASTACPGPYLKSKFSYIATEVNKRLSSGSSGGASSSELYRVRKSWADSKSQIGAYRLLANAKKKADKNKGYKVFNSSGVCVYPESSAELYRVRKSWSDSKSQLGAFASLSNAKGLADKNAGYKVFDSKGSCVYAPTSTSSKSVTDIAYEVIRGDWGNGADRKKRLEAAGYDYNEVQEKVNSLMK